MDDGVGVADEAADDVELLPAVRADEQLPMLWNNGQIGVLPLLVLPIIILRLRLLQHVAVGPGDDAAARTDKALFLPLRLREAFCQFPGHAGLLCDKQFHTIR